MIRKEFNTESDIRNYKSKVLLLPKKILMLVNQAIEDGAKEWRLENVIKQNYKGTLGVPTPPTLRVYRDWYIAKKEISQQQGKALVPTRTAMSLMEKEEVSEIAKEHQTILDSNTDISNKKELLEKLIRKCIQRMRSVESVQDMEGMTASLEAVVGHYIRETHNLVTTQLKLAGELQDETNEVIAKLVNQNLYSLILLMFDAVKEVRPEMVEPIKAKFFEKLQENKQLQELMSQQNVQ